MFFFSSRRRHTRLRRDWSSDVCSSDLTRIIIDVDFKLKGKMKISNIFEKNKFEKDYAKILDDFVKIAEN